MSQDLKDYFMRALSPLWSEGKLDILDEVCSADFVKHRPPFPDVVGVEAEKQSVAATMRAIPDVQFEIEEVVAEGNTVVARYIARGTHTGVWPAVPIPPTGKELVVRGCSVYRFKDGKLAEIWEYMDRLGMLQQLGVIPPLGVGR